MYVERTAKESLVDHLGRNADALALSSDQRRRLAEAYRLQMVGTHQAKTQAGQIAVEVRAELTQAVQAVIDQALERKEKVAAFNDAGAKHVKTRDGLLCAYDSGQLTGLTAEKRKADPYLSSQGWAKASARLQAGLAYRAKVELITSGLRSQLNGSVGGGSCVGGAEAQAGRAKAVQQLADVERELRGREVRTLLGVAAEGRTIRSMSSGGKAVSLNVTALIHGLDRSAQVFRTSGFDLL